ncbi:hypothetical protein EDC04DRAFT_1761720 [Pisolithus marmoratus]|nr:hypothetical protein EDC04DRAFT_1761720 [Pisolithus marmoratus]
MTHARTSPFSYLFDTRPSLVTAAHIDNDIPLGTKLSIPHQPHNTGQLNTSRQRELGASSCCICPCHLHSRVRAVELMMTTPKFFHHSKAGQLSWGHRSRLELVEIFGLDDTCLGVLGSKRALKQAHLRHVADRLCASLVSPVAALKHGQVCASTG